MLLLRSGAVYIGSTTNWAQRLRDHQAGEACMTTKHDPVDAVLLTEDWSTNVSARRRERQIKKWSRGKKLALAAGDLDVLKFLAVSRDHS
jgi:tRNA/rRNA methyltransferase